MILPLFGKMPLSTPGTKCRSTGMKIAFVPTSRIHEVDGLRNDILTKELGQYSNGTEEKSSILIGIFNDIGTLVGYVAINRPEKEGHKTPTVFPAWTAACEVRGLMVKKRYRGNGLGELLMNSALRFAQVSGYDLIIVSARDVLVSWYMRFGFVPCREHAYRVGTQTYIPGSFNVSQIDPIIGSKCAVTWDLPYPAARLHACVHGNGSNEVTGDDVIRADVLDAPFDPSPAVQRVALQRFDIRTTPPGDDELKKSIAKARDIPPSNIIVGPGSSALMYSVFPRWFGTSSKVLLVTPTYAEYPHLLSRLGCTVDSVPESMDVVHQIKTYGHLYDGIIVVNPNSPSGSYIPNLKDAFDDLDPTTRVWIDETYVDYVGGLEQSLEKFASRSPNVVVCKSMSKCYALSGARVAYIVGSGVQLETLSTHPPWWLSRASLKIGRAALTKESLAYYKKRLNETRSVVATMVNALRDTGWTIVGNPVASFVTCTPPRGTDAAKIVDALKEQKIYVRLAVGYPNSIRIAVQNPAKTRKILDALDGAVPSAKSIMKKVL